VFTLFFQKYIKLPPIVLANHYTYWKN